MPGTSVLRYMRLVPSLAYAFACKSTHVCGFVQRSSQQHVIDAIAFLRYRRLVPSLACAFACNSTQRNPVKIMSIEGATAICSCGVANGAHWQPLRTAPPPQALLSRSSTVSLHAATAVLACADRVTQLLCLALLVTLMHSCCLTSHSQRRRVIAAAPATHCMCSRP
jgi:hypothetical protein